MSSTGSNPGLPGGRRTRTIWLAAAMVVTIAALYVGLPAVAGLDETWSRLSRGNARWLAVAAILEGLSFGCYVVAFRHVVARSGARVDLALSYDITMAGLAATRLLAAGGAGGIALTAWALRRSGMARTAVATSVASLLVLLYGVYLLSVVFVGLGLRAGLLPGPAPFGLTVVPALLAGGVVVAALAAAWSGARDGWRPGEAVERGRAHRWGTAAWTTAATGVQGALSLVRERSPAVLGALGWWAFDVGVLWACFHAFGDPPPTAPLVLAYFVGMAANLLPLPGGVGGVEGGMIGAAIAFGAAPGLAIVAVLSYRALAFWLPTVPGVLAYVQLVRRLHRDDAAASV